MSSGCILVTGGTGFVGTQLVNELLETGTRVRVLSRRALADPRFESATTDGMSDPVCLDRIMAGVDAVCHLAGLAHRTGPDARTLGLQFEDINSTFSCRVAEAAFVRGVRRFVFVSSIGVVGNTSRPGYPLSEETPCKPATAYAQSKWHAERELRALAGRFHAELVVVRPPLVHGTGAPGNLARLARWIDRGIPLPLAGIDNQRSLIHVRNLARCLALCLKHPEAPGHTFHVRDPGDYSTPQILGGMAASLGLPLRLWHVPPAMLRMAAAMARQQEALQQLTGWLQVNDALVRRVLGFEPRALDFGVTACA